MKCLDIKIIFEGIDKTVLYMLTKIDINKLDFMIKNLFFPILFLTCSIRNNRISFLLSCNFFSESTIISNDSHLVRCFLIWPLNLKSKEIIAITKNTIIVSIESLLLISSILYTLSSVPGLMARFFQIQYLNQLQGQETLILESYFHRYIFQVCRIFYFPVKQIC